MSTSGAPQFVTGSDSPVDPQHFHVRAVADSAAFRRAPALRALLLYLWEHRSESLNEFRIATECLAKRNDFDPKVDATVRVHVSRLRQKLKEYYDSAETAPPYRISIPQGGYRVDVLAEAVPPEPALPMLVAPIQSPRRRFPVLPLVAGLLAIACVLLTIENRRLVNRVPQMPRFWADFFANGKPSTVVLPTPVFYEWSQNQLKVRDTRINDFEDFEKSALLKPLIERFGPPKLMQNYTVVSDTFAAVKLGQYLQSRGVNVAFNGTTDFSLDQFGNRNVMLIGLSSTSFHIRQLMDRTNFHSNPADAAAILNRNPKPGEAAAYRMVMQSNTRRSLSGLIAVLPGATADTRILMLAGWSSTSLVSFLTNDASLKQLDAAWRHAGSPRYFELLIHAEIDGNVVLRTSPVTLRPIPSNP